jgi:hypothetical protein
VCSWRVTLRSRLWRSWARRLDRMCLGVVLTGCPPRVVLGVLVVAGLGLIGPDLNCRGRLCERLRRVGQPRRGVAASRWWPIRGGGAA